MTSSTAPSETPWYAAYPPPRTAEPDGMSREEVLELLKQEKQGGGAAGDFVLVDLRRIDHEGGTIRGSINLPAQTLYPSLAALYATFKAAGVRKVIFYCGSSRGRGTRAAGWLADVIKEKGDEDMRSLTLIGGIKGWANAGDEFTQWMDGYDESVWRASGCN